jgi:hypothetical protein
MDRRDRLHGVSEVTGDKGDRGTVGQHRAGAEVPQAVELEAVLGHPCADEGGSPRRSVELVRRDL